MLRSLRARLLTVSMLVAVVSVAATAWLTTRDSGERLRDSVDRTLETDSDIYNQMVGYAATHPDWSGVDDLVARLSEDTGRRIALTTPQGEVIVDSARLQGHEGVPLPDKPAGLVDPFDMAMGFGSFDEAIPEEEVEATPEEKEERRPMVEEGEACLRERGLEPDVYVGSNGLPQLGVVYPDDATETEMAAGDLALIECTDPRLDDLSEAEVAAVREINRLEGACLDEAGVPYTVTSDVTGAEYLEVDGTSDHAVDVDTECYAQALRAAHDPPVADVAHLYLGQSDRRGITLADAGSGRTLAAAGAVTALALIVTVLASRRVLRPVAALTAAAQRMEEGDLTQRVDDRGRDELARLAHAFNSMADALAGHEQQRRRLASDVAHELRTPLANLRGYLEAAQDGVTPTDPALLGSLHEEALLLQRLVDDLQTLSLAESGRLPLALAQVDLGELAGQVVTAFQLTAEQAGVTLTAMVPDPDDPDADEPGGSDDAGLTAEADPGRLRQVLGNLVANALHHTPAGGTVTVTASASGLAVADTGAGIAPDHLPHVFDRFWRADESRTRDTGGSGLGLAISRQLVELHGGTLTAESTLGEGTTFTLTLPLHPQ